MSWDGTSWPGRTANERFYRLRCHTNGGGVQASSCCSLLACEASRNICVSDDVIACLMTQSPA